MSTSIMSTEILHSHYQLQPEEDNLRSDRNAADVLRPLVPKGRLLFREKKNVPVHGLK